MRCVTLNLKGLGAGWFETRFPAIVRGLKPLRPDVLFLQEVALRIGDRLYDQGAALAEALGLRYVSYAPYGNLLEVMSLEEGGIALASAWPFLRTRVRNLPSARVYPPDARVALFASIDSPEGIVDVVNTHLSWRPEESPVRVVQMGLILQELKRQGSLEGDRLTVVAGDLNSQETEPTVQLLRQDLLDAFRHARPDEPGFTDARSNPLSIPMNQPDRRLDYIFCTRAIRIRDCRVVLNRPGTPYPSDHFAVLADLRPGHPRRAKAA